jgi:beta-xylosidase
VLRADFPDPHVLPHGSEYLAYATNSGGLNVQMAVSSDLVTWTRLEDGKGKPHDAMPTLPAWAAKGATWAPEVMKVGDRFILYHTSKHAKRKQQCVGAAVSADPRGPFVDASAAPLVCQHDLGGTIDAHPFRDADGQLYLYFKNDGNHPSARKPTRIWGQRLSADGLSLVGEPAALITNDKAWEGGAVEAPSMVRTRSGYTLLFSANFFGWESQRLSPYAMGYAGCRGPLGPCTDAPDNPLLYSFSGKMGCLSGPGHQAVFQANGRQYIAFHGWAVTPGCRKSDPRRHMYISPLGWSAAGKPLIAPSLRPAAAKER